MPNNANPIVATPVAFQTYIPIDAPTQQPFGSVTTMINTFFTSVSFPITNSLGSFLIYGTSTSGTSSLEVADYNNHTFQFAVTGSGTSSFVVASSIDGWNWTSETSSTLMATTNATSSYGRLSVARRRYFQVSVSSSNVTTASIGVTASVYLLSGQ